MKTVNLATVVGLLLRTHPKIYNIEMIKTGEVSPTGRKLVKLEFQVYARVFDWNVEDKLWDFDDILAFYNEIDSWEL